MGLTPRHFRRLRRKWEHEGDRAVIHGLRGQRSNRALSGVLRARVLERAQEPVFSDFAPTLLAEHLSTDPAIGELCAHTLRRWMIEEGAMEAQTQRGQASQGSTPQGGVR